MGKDPSFDLTQARKDTPGCEDVLHFNNAGSSLPPQCVLDTVVSHLQREAQIGGYEAQNEAEEKLESTYTAIARLMNCHTHEIAVIENATRAWDMVFYAIPFKEGDCILTSQAEYASNYIAYLQVTRKTGARAKVIPDDEHGQVSLSALHHAIDKKTKLIAITHVPTQGGLVNPAEEIGKIARDASILYLLDACQSVGQMPLDVKRIGCHMLSATGRKYLRAPRGTGFLYVDQDHIEALEPPFLDLRAATWISDTAYTMRSDARRFENWETNCATKIGLGEAARYAQSWGLPAIWERIRFLADALRQQLSAIPGITLQDKGQMHCGIVTFTHTDVPASQIQQRLAAQRINTSVSKAAYA